MYPDFNKAFDKSDHVILVENLAGLFVTPGLPEYVGLMSAIEHK